MEKETSDINDLFRRIWKGDKFSDQVGYISITLKNKPIQLWIKDRWFDKFKCFTCGEERENGLINFSHSIPKYGDIDPANYFLVGCTNPKCKKFLICERKKK